MNQEYRLSRLAPGQSARVTELSREGSMRRRFQDLGVIPGTLVECLARSPLGDPCAYLIRGAVIALRKADAETIRTGKAFPSQETPACDAAGQREAGYGAF